MTVLHRTPVSLKPKRPYHSDLVPLQAQQQLGLSTLVLQGQQATPPHPALAPVNATMATAVLTLERPLGWV